MVLLYGLEYALDCVHRALEVGAFGTQLLAAGGGKGVVASAAVVFRCTPHALVVPIAPAANSAGWDAFPPTR